MLDLLDAIQASRIEDPYRETRLRVPGFQLQDSRVLRLGQVLQPGKEGIECEQAARQQVVSAAVQRPDLLVRGHVVDERIEGDHDQGEAALEPEIAHRGLVKPGLEAQ